MSVELPKLLTVLEVSPDPDHVGLALEYGLEWHSHAVAELADRAVRALARVPVCARPVLNALRVCGAPQQTPHFTTTVRGVLDTLEADALATALDLVACCEGDGARALVLKYLDDPAPKRSAATPALRHLSDGRELLRQHLEQAPTPDLLPGDVQAVFLDRPDWLAADVAHALRSAAGAGNPAAWRVLLELVGGVAYECGWLDDSPDHRNWGRAVAGECAPFVSKSWAREIAGRLRKGRGPDAARRLLHVVPAEWLGGEEGVAGGPPALARAMLRVLRSDSDLLTELAQADADPLCRLIAACIARLGDEAAGPEADPASASLPETVAALALPRPVLRNDEKWIARAASFGADAVEPLAQLLASDSFHVASRAMYALVRTREPAALEAILEVLEGEDESLADLADIVLHRADRRVLASVDHRRLVAALEQGNCSDACGVLARWTAPSGAAGPLVEAVLPHVEALLCADDAGPVIDFLMANPVKAFAEPVTDLWRPGEPGLAGAAALLLALHRPDHELLPAILEDTPSAVGKELIQEALSGRSVVLRLRCVSCGAAYGYELRDVLISNAILRRRHRPPLRDCAMIQDPVKCKRCGAIDDYEWTPAAEAVLALCLISERLGSVREDERDDEEDEGAVRIVDTTSSVGDALTSPELIERLSQKVARQPDDPEWRLRLGNAYCNSGRAKPALATYTELLDRWPDHAEGAFQRGALYGRLERWAEALDDYLRAAAALRPSHPMALGLAEALAESIRDAAANTGCKAPVDILDSLSRLRAKLGEATRDASRVPQPPGAPPAAPGPPAAWTVPDSATDVLSEPAPAVRTRPPGRNEPCPCGSGRKYKKCCGRTPAAPVETGPKRAPRDPAADSVGRRVARELQVKLARFAVQNVPRAERDTALARWFGDRKAALTGESIKDGLFLEYWLYDWRPDNKRGRTILKRFAEARGVDLSREEQAQLESWLHERRRGLYEVENVDSAGHIVSLRDRLTGDEFDVFDVALSRAVERGALCVTAVFPCGDRLEVSGFGAGVPRWMRERFETWLRSEFEGWRACRPQPGAMWSQFFSERAAEINAGIDEISAAPPRVVLPTGEPVSPGRKVYAVSDRRAVIAAIEARPEPVYTGWGSGEDVEGDAYAWQRSADAPPLPFERPVRDGEVDSRRVLVICSSYIGRDVADEGAPGDPETDTVANLHLGPDRIEVQSLSRERLAYVCGIIEAELGSSLSEVHTHLEPPEAIAEAWRERGNGRPPRWSEQPDVRFKHLEAAFLTQYWSEWPDQPVPALDGRTPRECARDPALRSKLEALLRDFEETPGDRDRVAKLRGELRMP